MLIPIGLAFAPIYNFLFRYVINRWNLRTPGREEDDVEPDSDASKPQIVDRR